MASPLCSICITHLNNAPTLRRSLESILNQIDEGFEIVVVDQGSTDGSWQMLQEYEKAGVIKLHRQPIRNRGLGRELAFEKSRGEYIISNVDLDDVFLPKFAEFVSLYRERCDGVHLWNLTGASIIPRSLVLRLGGWRDLNYGEDLDLASRAAQAGRYRNTKHKMFAFESKHPDRHSLIGEMRFTYLYQREQMRLKPWRFTRPTQLLPNKLIPIMAAAVAQSRMKSYRSWFTFYFNFKDPKYYVSFS